MSEDGLLENALHISEAKQIDAEIFEHYIEFVLISALPPKSIVIFDNASPHSLQFNKPPNSSSNKTQIKEWLTNNNIPFEENIKKK